MIELVEKEVVTTTTVTGVMVLGVFVPYRIFEILIDEVNGSNEAYYNYKVQDPEVRQVLIDFDYIETPNPKYIYASDQPTKKLRDDWNAWRQLQDEKSKTVAAQYKYLIGDYRPT